MGAKFDIRQFHAQVLMTGALPLPVLEAKIDRWIAEFEGELICGQMPRECSHMFALVREFGPIELRLLMRA